MLKSRTLLAIAFVFMVLSLYAAFIFAPEEKVMGIAQRIFYVHVPVAWIGLLGFGVVFVGSIMYLRKKEERWDIMAKSSAEVGLVFIGLALITGPLWARPTWGAWWMWEPRLTSTLILGLIYVAYLMVRAYASDESRGARFGAVVGIIGFVDVPIVYLATTLWRSMHPGQIVAMGALDPRMSLALMLGVVAFTLLYILLLRRVMERNRLARELDKLGQSLKK